VNTKERHPRRFSEGMERVPVAPEVRRVGRFSDVEKRVARRRRRVRLVKPAPVHP